MLRTTLPAVLNRIEVTKWVQETARKMTAARSESRETWNESWLDTYLKLGGRARTTGEKPCPMAAAYGLWYLGLLTGVARNRRAWNIGEIRQKLGKNAVYAVIASELLAGGAAPVASSLWPCVRERYKQLTDDVAAESEQGEIRLVIALYREQQLVDATWRE